VGATVLLRGAGRVTPGVTEAAARQPAPAPPAPPDPTPTGPPPEAPALEPPPAFSLSLSAHAEPGVAEARLATLSERAPEVWFGIVPVEVGGTAYRRLLAGLAPDSGAVEALRSRLGALLGEEPDGWVARRTHLAFLVATSPDRAEAEGAVAGLAQGGIPAYVLQVDRSDGSTLYDVYAGAFADAEEAAALRATLQRAGVTAPLRERRGSLPR